MAQEPEELNSCILFTKQFLAQINPFEIVFYGFDIYHLLYKFMEVTSQKNHKLYFLNAII